MAKSDAWEVVALAAFDEPLVADAACRLGGGGLRGNRNSGALRRQRSGWLAGDLDLNGVAESARHVVHAKRKNDN